MRNVMGSLFSSSSVTLLYSLDHVDASLRVNTVLFSILDQINVSCKVMGSCVFLDSNYLASYLEIRFNLLEFLNLA